MEETELKTIEVPEISHPIYYRENTTDRSTLEYIFKHKEFELSGLSFRPKWIIDGGAYVGYSSLYFANVYPDAQIVAIEPDRKNFDILNKNIKPYKQVQTLNNGIWYKNTHLKVNDVGLGEWGMMVEETKHHESDSFSAITIPSIMERFGIDEIDILKLNIEGAEKELFSEGYDKWLSKVKILIIELHDRMKRGCSKAFFKAIKPYHFSHFKRGAFHYLYKEGSFLNS